MRAKWIIPIFILSLFQCVDQDAESDMNFTLEPGSTREIAYTDKGDAHWVTRAGGYNSSPWHGLTASKRGYFEDLFISVGGVLLPRESAEVTVTPVSLKRYYREQGIKETWTLLDEKRTLLVELEAEEAQHWTLQPAILGGSQPEDFEIKTSEQGMDVLLRRMRDVSPSYAHLKLRFSDPVSWSEAESPELPLFTAFLTPRAVQNGSPSLAVTISLGEESGGLELDPERVDSAKGQRRKRIEQRAALTAFESNLPELDKAVFWAHHSLDGLVMDQQGKGIYAGLPWFDDYWGRDAFISFTGAVLVSGQHRDAREILLSFAELQNKDEFDPDYGRVPNRAQPDNIIYNTTDGTPWFVRSVWDYYRYSGDAEFLRDMWPAIRRATEGSLMNWVDEDGLLRHADADTWMDAKGPEGPWSPRGDRAIDIQFIWRDQLEITRLLAERYRDRDIENEVGAVLKKFDASLEKFKTKDGKYFVDHLNQDGSQDPQVRPNVFLVPELFQQTCDWSTFQTLAPRLITRQGVLSLAQDDPNFHPYHHLPGMYVQDAAYHNGIIWTWNSAATITPAIQFHQYHYAEAIFKNLTNQVIQRGAVGTIAELTDAWPRDGELQLSGTFSQAWSLAEYLRALYQDILGIQPDLANEHVSISPRLLSDMKEVKFVHVVGRDTWQIEYVDMEKHFDISIIRSAPDPIKVSLDLLANEATSHLDLNWEQTSLNLRYEKFMGQWTVPSGVGEYFMSREEVAMAPNSLAFCELDTSREVPVLKGPEHRLLSEGELHKFSADARVLLNIADAKGDDKGHNGRYTYPGNPQFEKGLADIMEFGLKSSDDSYEFELLFSNLVDPGWHPEYGYQLTYVALGISYAEGSGTSEVGKNAQASFQKGFKADEIIYVSGGVLLVDHRHEPLAEYMPRTPAGAIGDAEQEKVRFSLPRDIFSSELEGASFQIAVGCQDDHGGAGIGDFRPVEPEGGEWIGGGGSLTGSNVYDWLLQ